MPAKNQAQKKVIVIGAGMAGLTAAAYLAQAGHTVIVFEQFSTIGGVAATDHQDGFGWNVGPQLLAGFASDEWGGRILRELGIAHRVRLQKADRGCVFPDFDLSKPGAYAGPAWRRERLKRLFPAEHEGIDHYTRFTQRGMALWAAERRAELARWPLKAVHRLRRRLARTRVKDRARWSAQRLLDTHFVDPRLKAVFAAPLTGLLVPPGRFAALDLPALNAETGFDCRVPRRPAPFAGKCPSYHVILGGTGTLVEAVAAIVRKHGGTLYTGTTVEKVLVDADRVTGVRLLGGRVETADVVICTGGARATFFGLVGREYLPAGLAYQVDILKLMASVLEIHLGIDFDPRPYQSGALCTYYGTYDVAGAIAACRRGEFHEGHDGFEIAIPTLYSSELAPEGHHVVTVLTVAPDELKDGSWQSRRRELVSKLLAQAETVIPGLRAHAKVQKVLTPHDFRARTLQAPHAFGGAAPLMGQEAPGYATPIDGLWFIGSQSRSGGGVQNVMVGAREAARSICGKLRKR